MVTTLDAVFEQAVQRTRHPDAEAAVLGGCIIRPDVLAWLELDRGAFFDARHALVWDAMQALFRESIGIDEQTLCSWLRTAGKLEAAGGEAYIAQLGLRVPTVDNVIHYAGVVRGGKVTRDLLYLAASVPERFTADCGGEELLGDVQRSLSAIDPGTPEENIDLSHALEQELLSIRQFFRDGKRNVGVPTGIQQLDEKIGGLIVGAPTVLGARPAGGKSTFALNVAVNAAGQGMGVHVFTYEDRRNTFAQRRLALHAGVPVDRIRSRQFHRGELDRVGRAKEELCGKPSHIEVEHAHGMPVETVVRRVRARRKALGTKLVILDYIQLAPSPDRRMKRYEGIGANMVALTELAGKDDLAVLVLSQLGRESEKEKRRPEMSDLRESGDIEQNAKLILALHSLNREAPTVELCILKNHQGPPAVFDLPYDRALCRMG